MNFGSDNQSWVAEPVMAAMQEANQGFNHGYSDDPWTHNAEALLREVFDCDLKAYFVATGTAANSLALSSLVQPWQTVLCHKNAHVFLDESTAPEFFTGGARLTPLPDNGKIAADSLRSSLDTSEFDVPHNPKPGALSITQSSEIGLAYTPDEVAALSAVCKAHGLRLHMDGARFSNALVANSCSAAELTWKAGVDVLCLGATKCGALCAEAVIFFDPTLAEGFAHRRKRSGHLVSKGRLFGAQFCGWLKNDSWLQLAAHANQQANKLAEGLKQLPGNVVQAEWPVQANQLFVTLPKGLAQELRNKGAEFYDWYPSALPSGRTLGPDEAYIRLVTSFATQDSHVSEFLACANTYLSKAGS